MYYEINNDKWLSIKDLPHEEWKDIVGFETLYKISSFGRVKSIKRYGCSKDRILKARVDKKGYIHYALKKDGKTFEKKAHRLVAKAYVENVFNKPQVNHLDGNKINNYYKNLEWVTNSENQIHAFIINPNRNNIFRTNNPRKKTKDMNCI